LSVAPRTCSAASGAFEIRELFEANFPRLFQLGDVQLNDETGGSNCMGTGGPPYLLQQILQRWLRWRLALKINLWKW
jgi:hypothetical protein